jgi:predicted metal-dependent hydrolase
MSHCKECDKERNRGRKRGSHAHDRKVHQIRMDERANGINTEKYILWDAQRNDRGNGIKNDLDINFVRELISQGCQYCGAEKAKVKMSLDRKDNLKGHFRENVIAACLNCNLTRGNMPYEAWMIVASSMRKVYEAGLLDGWMRRSASLRQ